MYRLILDTNVLINGVQDENSYAYRIISLCLESKLQAIISDPIKRENQLLATRNITDEEYLNIIDDYFENAEMIRVHTKQHFVEDDHEDDKFVQAAIDGEADFIISSDHHLLDLGECGKTKIITPEEFWNIYSSEEEQGQEEWQKWVEGIGARR